MPPPFSNIPPPDDIVCDRESTNHCFPSEPLVRRDPCELSECSTVPDDDVLFSEATWVSAAFKGPFALKLLTVLEAKGPSPDKPLKLTFLSKEVKDVWPTDESGPFIEVLSGTWPIRLPWVPKECTSKAPDAPWALDDVLSASSLVDVKRVIISVSSDKVENVEPMLPRAFGPSDSCGRDKYSMLEPWLQSPLVNKGFWV